jgi:hypothetical protein
MDKLGRPGLTIGHIKVKAAILNND